MRPSRLVILILIFSATGCRFCGDSDGLSPLVPYSFKCELETGQRAFGFFGKYDQDSVKVYNVRLERYQEISASVESILSFENKVSKEALNCSEKAEYYLYFGFDNVDTLSITTKTYIGDERCMEAWAATHKIEVNGLLVEEGSFSREITIIVE